jgi:hypothetical protein
VDRDARRSAYSGPVQVEAPSHAPPAAYELYLKGRRLYAALRQYGESRCPNSSFEDALKSDAQFALAYAGLGKAYWLKYRRDRDSSAIKQAAEYSKRSAKLTISSLHPMLFWAESTRPPDSGSLRLANFGAPLT